MTRFCFRCGGVERGGVDRAIDGDVPFLDETAGLLDGFRTAAGEARFGARGATARAATGACVLEANGTSGDSCRSGDGCRARLNVGCDGPGDGKVCWPVEDGEVVVSFFASPWKLIDSPVFCRLICGEAARSSAVDLRFLSGRDMGCVRYFGE